MGSRRSSRVIAVLARTTRISLSQAMRWPAAVGHPGRMKVVNYATYSSMREKAAALRPAHREYMTRLHADGQLVAYGPFADGGGALLIYETGSLAIAGEILAADPYQIGGVFAGCRLGSWDVVKANPALLRAAP
jgi:uncharacterized protein YciI